MALRDDDAVEPGHNLLVWYKLVGDVDEARVTAAVKTLGRWARLQPNVWFINSELNSTVAASQLLDVIGSESKIFVVDAFDNSAAWSNLSDKVSDFIEARWTQRP